MTTSMPATVSSSCQSDAKVEPVLRRPAKLLLGTQWLMPDVNLESARQKAANGREPTGLFTKVAELPNGGVALSGTFTSIGGKSRAGLARLMPTGLLDESFNPTIKGSVYDMVVRPNGNIIVGGRFTLGGTQGIMNLAEID